MFCFLVDENYKFLDPQHDDFFVPKKVICEMRRQNKIGIYIFTFMVKNSVQKPIESGNCASSNG